MLRDGARLSQNFTSSRASVVLKAHEIIRISDLVGDDPTSPGASALRKDRYPHDGEDVVYQLDIKPELPRDGVVRSVYASTAF